MRLFEDDQLCDLFSILEDGVKRQKYSAWSAGTKSFAIAAYYADEATPLSGRLKEPREPYFPHFDLASLTKALFANVFCRTRLSQLDLVRHDTWELLDESREVGGILARYLKSRSRPSSVLQFLDHEMGSKPWIWFGRGQWVFQGEKARALLPRSKTGELGRSALLTLTRACLAAIDENQSAQVYSDVDYFILTRILENLKQNPVRDWTTALDELNEANGTQLVHASISGEATQCAIPSYPYVVCEKSEDVGDESYSKFGSPHDTNANILSSLGSTEAIVSGHAGLYGSVVDVLKMLTYLDNSQRTLRSEIKKSHPEYGNGKRFAFGLDTPGDANSLSSPPHWPLLAGEHIAGHLGYTGTAAWFLQKEEDSKHAVVLTNRTAQRVRLGGQRIPRLVSLLEFKTNQASYFIVDDKCSRAVDSDEFISTNQFYYKTSRRYWNDGVLHAPVDIGDVRRGAGRLLWSY